MEFPVWPPIQALTQHGYGLLDPLLSGNTYWRLRRTIPLGDEPVAAFHVTFLSTAAPGLACHSLCFTNFLVSYWPSNADITKFDASNLILLNHGNAVLFIM
jgi:hypothetical protein